MCLPLIALNGVITLGTLDSIFKFAARFHAMSCGSFFRVKDWLMKDILINRLACIVPLICANLFYINRKRFQISCELNENDQPLIMMIMYFSAAFVIIDCFTNGMGMSWRLLITMVRLSGGARLSSSIGSPFSCWCFIAAWSLQSSLLCQFECTSGFIHWKFKPIFST